MRLAPNYLLMSHEELRSQLGDDDLADKVALF